MGLYFVAYFRNLKIDICFIDESRFLKLVFLNMDIFIISSCFQLFSAEPFAEIKITITYLAILFISIIKSP